MGSLNGMFGRLALTLPCLLGFCLVSVKCSGPRAAGTHVVSVEFHSNPGKGTADRFDAVMSESGTLKLNGARDGQKTGEHGIFEAQLAPGAFAALASDLDSEGFFQLKPKYSNAINDVGERIVVVESGHAIKRVVDDGGAPNSLSTIEDEIRKAISGARSWRKI